MLIHETIFYILTGVILLLPAAVMFYYLFTKTYMDTLPKTGLIILVSCYLVGLIAIVANFRLILKYCHVIIIEQDGNEMIVRERILLGETSYSLKNGRKLSINTQQPNCVVNDTDVNLSVEYLNYESANYKSNQDYMKKAEKAARKKLAGTKEGREVLKIMDSDDPAISRKMVGSPVVHPQSFEYYEYSIDYIGNNDKPPAAIGSSEMRGIIGKHWLHW